MYSHYHSASCCIMVLNFKSLNAPTCFQHLPVTLSRFYRMTKVGWTGWVTKHTRMPHRVARRHLRWKWSGRFLRRWRRWRRRCKEHSERKEGLETLGHKLSKWWDLMSSNKISTIAMQEFNKLFIFMLAIWGCFMFQYAMVGEASHCANAGEAEKEREAQRNP